MSDDDTFTSAKTAVRTAVEDFLRRKFAEYPLTEVRRAAEYAVLGGGHRWRPIVATAAGTIFRNDALEVVLPGACGVELAHTASLILDDLPSMDDAAIRRGKPATHTVFPSWAVDMTPVFLMAMAYKVSLENPIPTRGSNIAAAIALSEAGLDMIAGQVKDLEQYLGNVIEEAVLDCYRLKSAALYAAAAKAGGLLCGANEEEAGALARAGLNLGMSYQMLDDVADVTASVEEVGKESGMDEQKTTAVDLYGVDGARKQSKLYQDRALGILQGFGPTADWLRCVVCEASYKAF